MNKNFWDEKFGTEEFIYGTEPNEYLKEELEHLQKGKALFVCEGEGRNAVYAATKGWEVLAFDQSEEGKKKSFSLAQQKKTKIEFLIADAAEFVYGEEQYDLVVLIYAHFPPHLRNHVHKHCLQSLKPGGILLLEAFNPKQLSNNSGGPKDPTMLYSKEMMEKDFAGQNYYIELLQTELHEGKYHEGLADIIRVKVVKK
jgi:2-polyprenyl-3-methyl-5-hydroxy-6-metoxy-1,4-benzoquinol methylase